MLKVSDCAFTATGFTVVPRTGINKVKINTAKIIFFIVVSSSVIVLISIVFLYMNNLSCCIFKSSLLFSYGCIISGQMSHNYHIKKVSWRRKNYLHGVYLNTCSIFIAMCVVIYYSKIWLMTAVFLRWAGRVSIYKATYCQNHIFDRIFLEHVRVERK